MECYKHAKLSLSLSLYSVCTFHHPVILIERILEPRFLLRYCRQKLVHGAGPRNPLARYLWVLPGVRLPKVTIKTLTQYR